MIVNETNVRNVKIKKLNKDAKIPKYAHSGDSGFDLAAIENVTIVPGETTIVKTGLAISVPKGTELQIRPRSGTSLKTSLRIVNSPGTVDSNYLGEVGIIVQNTGHRAIFLEKGERIAQGVICPVYEARFVEVEEFEETTRGSGGFGSTGNN